jgi:hypothetical protein
MNEDPELARKGTYSSIVAARWLSEFANSEFTGTIHTLTLVLIDKALPAETIAPTDEQLRNLGNDLNAELARQGGLYPLRVVWARKPY